MSMIKHEEIVEKFMASEAIDFNALGRFVAEFGPQIATTSRGDYGVRFGHYNILACFNMVRLDVQLEPLGGRLPGIASEVTGKR
jgi:hypothetical protein